MPWPKYKQSLCLQRVLKVVGSSMLTSRIQLDAFSQTNDLQLLENSHRYPAAFHVSSRVFYTYGQALLEPYPIIDCWMSVEPGEAGTLWLGFPRGRKELAAGAGPGFSGAALASPKALP